MPKEPLIKNKNLGHLIAIVFFILVGYFFYSSAIKMNYIWKWNSIPKYFAYEKEILITSPSDAIITKIDKNKIVLEGEFGEEEVKINKNLKILVSVDENVFLGDTLAQTTKWTLGPILLGLLVTLQISAVSAVIALFIGLIVAIMKMSNYQFLKDIAIVYVQIIRGTPLLVQIFIFYFIIATIFELDRFLAGALSLGIFFGAYIAEVLRGAIQSIDKGQYEASKSLGMNYFQTMHKIIIPQALKRALPTLINEMIALVKDSSLVSVISITDLTKVGREIVSNTFSPFETWIVIALIYFSITFILSIIGHKIEKTMKQKGGF